MKCSPVWRFFTQGQIFRTECTEVQARACTFWGIENPNRLGSSITAIGPLHLTVTQNLFSRNIANRGPSTFSSNTISTTLSRNCHEYSYAVLFGQAVFLQTFTGYVSQEEESIYKCPDGNGPYGVIYFTNGPKGTSKRLNVTNSRLQGYYVIARENIVTGESHMNTIVSCASSINQFCQSGNHTISYENHVNNTKASEVGAGLFHCQVAANATIISCILMGNVAYSPGTAVLSDGSTAVFINYTFYSNTFEQTLGVTTDVKPTTNILDLLKTCPTPLTRDFSYKQTSIALKNVILQMLMGFK